MRCQKYIYLPPWWWWRCRDNLDSSPALCRPSPATGDYISCYYLVSRHFSYIVIPGRKRTPQRCWLPATACKGMARKYSVFISYCIIIVRICITQHVVYIGHHSCFLKSPCFVKKCFVVVVVKPYDRIAAILMHLEDEDAVGIALLKRIRQIGCTEVQITQSRVKQQVFVLNLMSY